MKEGTGYKIPGIQIMRRSRLGPLTLCCHQLRLNGCGHPCGNLVLEHENVAKLAIISFSPNMVASMGVRELRCYAYSLSALAHAAFKDVANLKVATNLPYVHTLALVGKCGIPGD